MGIAAILVVRPGSFKQTFFPPSQGGSTWNLTDTVVSQEMFEDADDEIYWPSAFWDDVDDEIWVTLDQGQRMTLTSGTCISPCTYLLYTVNFLNIRTPKKFVVIILKFELCSSTME